MRGLPGTLSPGMVPVGRFSKHVASRLLARDAVFRGVQKGLRSGLEARRMVDRNADRVWAALNLISRRDVELLIGEVQRLREQVLELRHRVATLQAETPTEKGPPSSE